MNRKSRHIILPPDFYARPALVVARELIGKTLVRKIGDSILTETITETEAYIGPQDKACHAHRGQTPRNAVMFGPGGYWYVYFIYGMHWMLNIVTNEDGFPSAVLFRAAGSLIGPGRLTRKLQIDRSLNGLPAKRASGLWIEDHGVTFPARSIHRTPRIGVAYAGEWAHKPYRFLVDGQATRARKTGDRG
jgi:DNA-3-methyladenine glycosylase